MGELRLLLLQVLLFGFIWAVSWICNSFVLVFIYVGV